MLDAIDDDAVPRVLVDLDTRTGDRVDVLDEVSAEGEREVLDLADAVLFGEGEAGVLLRVGSTFAWSPVTCASAKSPRNAVDTLTSRISCRGPSR